MDKRYQVFVSSTFEDLQLERQEVMHALLELDCIPAGMELFPAADDDQWTLIEKVIDDCDYYVVIVGGRYGSISSSGISYTQMEYEYAVSQGKPVIGFIHRDPGSIPASKTEQSEEGRAKLEALREVIQQKMCKYWSSPDELGSVVSRSLVKLIKSKPTVGWVRADQASPDLLQQLQQAREKIDHLEEELLAARTQPPPGTDNLAQGVDETNVKCYIPKGVDGERTLATVTITWDELFVVIGPALDGSLSEEMFRNRLSSGLQRILERRGERFPAKSVAVDVDDFQRVKYQFLALGLIALDASKYSRDCELTAYGRHFLVNLLAQPKSLRKQAPRAKSARQERV